MPPKFYELDPRLFMRGHTRHFSTPQFLHLLQDHNIKMVVNVAIIKDRYLEGACRTIGMTYRHEPMSDGSKIDIARVVDLATEVAKNMDFYGVLVHCDSGWNRSALICCLALMRHRVMSAKQAIDHVRSVRPGALRNQTFLKFLQEGVIQMLMNQQVGGYEAEES